MSLRLKVESLDLEANGVARHDGKVVFVRGALPGEVVSARIVRRKPRFDVAEIESIERASVLRAAPRCPHFGTCGGCSMQHVDARAQVAIKQRVLEDTLWHVAKVRAGTVLAPIVGPEWGYRHRARLSVRHVPKKGGVLVGFHERGSSYVADMRTCHVLPPRVAGLLLPLRALVESMSVRDRLPQVEVALGDTVLALVFRVLEPPSPADLERLRAFGDTHRLEVWLQPRGPESIELAWSPGGASSDLHYALPEFGLTLPFRPTDFTQVNAAINASLVSRAVRLLDPKPDDTVLDLFCGLGNFTLPLATRAARVVGVEGSASLVARARDAAAASGLAARTEFAIANLFELDAARWQALGRVDRVLVDPPREGALAVARVLADPATARPNRLVYVSCNPATLARDAAVLVHEGGWSLAQAGVVNMFPHTSHVESIAVFEPGTTA